MKDLEFHFSEVKNYKLKDERGICFDDVIEAVMKGNILDIKYHHDKRKYPRQKILVIELNGYAYQIPFVENKKMIFLKTIYPSRKATATYLKKDGGDNDEHKS